VLQHEFPHFGAGTVDAHDEKLAFASSRLTLAKTSSAPRKS
jgi:hypothetical protein